MNIVITGGGTGGHMFPGIAVAEKLKDVEPDCGIYFIGTVKGIENRLKDDYGFKFYAISASGYLGKNIMNKIKSVLSIIRVIPQISKIYYEVKPDFVLGLGGYASFMPVLFAKMKGIRTGVMEQNIEPGLSNRILGLLGIMIFASYDETKKFFRFSEFFATGNPVRKNILEMKAAVAAPDTGKKELSVFVFGGSQGASSLNKAVIDMIYSLKDDIKQNLNIYHQTGEKDFEFVNNFYRNSGVKGYEVFKFIKNIEDYYRKADIIIARSGAGTLSELAALKKPAILVPYPFAAKGHQMKNAMYLSKKGCACIIKDNEILAQELLQTVTEIFYDRSLLAGMFNNLNEFGVKDSALDIVHIILNKK